MHVTLVVRGTRLLRHLDAEVSDRVHRARRPHGGTCGSARDGGRRDRRRPAASASTSSDGSTVDADLLLVATGRDAEHRPTWTLAAAGVATHADGRVAVDCYGRTNVDGVWALGDVCSPYQLKHVANHEARVVAHNLAHPDDLREVDHRLRPARGLHPPADRQRGLHRGRGPRAAASPTSRATQAYGDTAYGWAMEDTTGICKLVADPRTGLLLGRAPDGPAGVEPDPAADPGMSLRADASGEMARGQYWIHPALAEVVENALLKLELADVEDLTTYPLTP